MTGVANGLHRIGGNTEVRAPFPGSEGSGVGGGSWFRPSVRMPLKQNLRERTHVGHRKESHVRRRYSVSPITDAQKFLVGFCSYFRPGVGSGRRGEVSLTPGPDCERFVKLHLEFIIYHVHHRELLDII